MRKGYFLPCVLICFLGFANNTLDSLYIKLDEELSNKQVYDRNKESRIQSLIDSYTHTTSLIEKYDINDKIFEEYQFYSFDQALHYLERNSDIANKLNNYLYLSRVKLKMGLLLVNTGRYKESIDALNEIKKDSLSGALLNNYYLVFKEGYSGLSFNTAVNASRTSYFELYNAYQDSLYTRINPTTEEALRLKEKQFRDSRNLKEAFLVNSERLKAVTIGSRLYSLITFERALLYELKNDSYNQKKFLILSAISDIRASVKDNASLGALAEILFNEGDIDRAHQYINFSYDDAEFFNSELRFINIANSMPVISKAYEDKNEKQKDKLQKSVIYSSTLALFLFVAVFLIFKQFKRISKARNQLKKANEDLVKLNKELSALDEIKETYIGSFLNLYSEYITKLDVYRKLVNKYVKSNQMNALIKLSKSKQMIEEELEIFNKNFDNSFLHMYPDFADSINLLLHPDKQIEMLDKTKLNTDLRILALIKLGITSSSKIAEILRYSVNTIYNYRASLYKAAIDKHNFEENIRSIN